MRLTLHLDGVSYRVDPTCAHDLSIPLRFHGPQPNFFGVPRAASVPYRQGSVVGDTRQGGSCNFEVHTIIPHCQGTHTEGVGHVTRERIPILDLLDETLLPATLVSVRPEDALASPEAYLPRKAPGDTMITAARLRDALEGRNRAFLRGVVLRTLPNDPEKAARNYDEAPLPPYLSLDAVDFLSDLGVRHLLVDLPSIDRMHDEGRLCAHHRFWEVPPGVSAPEAISPRTITEMIFVPDDVADGLYLLNLQVAGFEADAAPSRPILYEVYPDVSRRPCLCRSEGP